MIYLYILVPHVQQIQYSHHAGVQAQIRSQNESVLPQSLLSNTNWGERSAFRLLPVGCLPSSCCPLCHSSQPIKQSLFKGNTWATSPEISSHPKFSFQQNPLVLSFRHFYIPSHSNSCIILPVSSPSHFSRGTITITWLNPARKCHRSNLCLEKNPLFYQRHQIRTTQSAFAKSRLNSLQFPVYHHTLFFSSNIH